MEYKKYVEILNEKRSITYIITNELIRNRPNRIHRLIILLFLSLPFRLSSLSLPGEYFPKIRETTSFSPKQQVLCAKRNVLPVSQTFFDNVAVCSIAICDRIYIYVYIYISHVCIHTHTYIHLCICI